FSLTQLASRAAAQSLTNAPHAPGSQAGSEAIAARAVFDAVGASELTYFEPVASMPGFPRALARTLHELRLAGVGIDRLKAAGGTEGCEIGLLLARVEDYLDRAAVDDRAAVFRAAAQACLDGKVAWAELPLVLLDVPIDSRVEREFVAALVQRAPRV